MQNYQRLYFTSRMQWLFLCLFPILLEAQTLITDSISLRLQQQMDVFPQEKVYLHTDKPHYVCGERIWFRAYLVDAFTLCDNTESRYVYVELLAPDASLVKCVKIKKRNQIFSGYLQLDDSLAEGNYTLRAYTTMMIGQPDYLFQKNIYVSNPKQKAMRADVHFTEKGKHMDAAIRFSNLTDGRRMHPQHVLATHETDTLALTWDGRDSVYRTTVRNTSSSKPLLVSVGNFRQFLSLPHPTSEPAYDVSFFPEGGHLIPDTWCRVGFKALGADGWSIQVDGTVYEEGGGKQVSFSSFYKGMGYFYLRPRAGKQYYALCRDAEGRELRFELPRSSDESCALTVAKRKKDIFTAIHQGTAVQNRKVTLIVHSRGEVYYIAPWNWEKNVVRFPLKMFPDGIVQFLLLDEQGRPLSERLVFCRNNGVAQSEIHSDQSQYATRERVRTRLKIRRADGSPLSGSLSVSVTDKGVVRSDTSLSVYASLLLSSELRGPIESPAYYFGQEGRRREAALDALMLTQGWRRYDMAAVARGQFKVCDTPLEIGQAITGHVIGGLRYKPLEKCQVGFATLDRRLADVTETDKEGRFCFEGFEFADSTRFYIRAMTQKGSDLVELHLDEEIRPAVSMVRTDQGWQSSQLDEYSQRMDEILLREDGMRNIWLDEIVKIAPKKLPAVKDILATHSYGGDYFKKHNITTLIELLRRIPRLRITSELHQAKKSESTDIQEERVKKFPQIGVPIIMDKIRFEGVTYPVLVVIDNVPMNDPYFAEEEFDYSSILFMDVEHVHVYRPSESAIFGQKGSGGVIEITTKKGTEVSEKSRSKNSLVYMPLGYQKHATFYSPTYTQEKKETDIPDLRTTLYWNPDIRLNERGEAEFEFYTADSSTEYRIKLEGISAGIIVDQTTTLLVEESSGN